MSKSDIIQQLPNLPRGDHREILERIWEIEEADLLTGAQPDAEEKALLDHEYDDYIANPNTGTDWKEVATRLRQQLRK